MGAKQWALVVVISLGSLEASAQQASGLQTRVDALAQQIDLIGRGDAAYRAGCRDQATAVIDAWNRAPHTRENRSRMEDWLDEALAKMMAGRRDALPQTPQFSRAVAAELVPVVVQPPLPTIVAAPPLGLEQSTPAPKRSSAKPILAPQPATPPPITARNNKWSQHPSAAPLEWQDPFRSNPIASPNPLRTGTHRETRPVSHGGPSSVQVNLNQLRAEVRGYNAALRELQALVLTPDCGVSELIRIAEELERLAETEAFISLYRSGLTGGEQQAMPDSPSAEVIRELARRRAKHLLSDSTSRDAATQDKLRRLTDRLVDNELPGSF